MTRDIDWGIPVPLDGLARTTRPSGSTCGSTRSIGYLSRVDRVGAPQGDPERWREWWNDPEALSYYFMGKDNITFHSQIWPAELLGVRRARATRAASPGRSGCSTCRPRWCSSEFLTMEGKQFSSSRGYVIYVRDVL